MRVHYTASNIQVLHGLEAVRRRPAMYIGSTGSAGLHNLVVEVVQNAIDEALVGVCTEIAVTLHQDGSCSVTDNGRGIPFDLHEGLGIPACEVVMTTLHSGGKFTPDVYDAPGGLHGIGLAAVNALSSWVVLDIWRDGQHVRQAYYQGVPQALEHLPIAGSKAETGAAQAAPKHGTQVHFLPDPSIFKASKAHEPAPTFDGDALREHLEAQAYLEEGLTLHFYHEGSGETTSYTCPGGLAGYVAHLNTARQALHADVICLRGQSDDVRFEVALQWSRHYGEDLRGFVNRIRTPQGGSHLDGLKTALTRVVQTHALERLEGEELSGLDVREGLTAVLSVRMHEPEFDSQTKSVLTSPRVAGVVETLVVEQLKAYLQAHPETCALLVGRALEASRARAASRRASERARYQRRDLEVNKEVYRQQFGVRSKNWHDSARWITDGPLLALHAAATRVRPDARVLDACCGSGVVGDAFRGRVGHITGLDITPQMAALARTRLDDVVLGDVYQAPFPDNHFDLVVNREVLHLLPNPQRPVAELYRVLRPGGQLIVGQLLPYGPADAAWMFRLLKKKQPLMFNNFLDQDFYQLLAGAGFVDIEMTETTQWEDIDTWIDTWETSLVHRHEIRDLYHQAPAEVRAVHPFRIAPNGRIEDCWRWCVFSAFKPGPRDGPG